MRSLVRKLRIVNDSSVVCICRVFLGRPLNQLSLYLETRRLTGYGQIGDIQTLNFPKREIRLAMAPGLLT